MESLYVVYGLFSVPHNEKEWVVSKTINSEFYP